MKEHGFTENIRSVLKSEFGELAETILEKSELLQYINIKTRSANSGSKARGSFANLYAIYVLIEDYINNEFDKKDSYSEYEGAIFSNLLKRQRELPFGGKLQNHALNSRMNEEFKKFFEQSDFIPILRNLSTNRYWINDNLLKVEIGGKIINIAHSIILIIDEYIKTKQDAFEQFITTCEKLQEVVEGDDTEIVNFIINLLKPNVDARLFEIVSYSILKYYYDNQKIYWGFEVDKLNEEKLKLYKTGRTNANDGGIDFVMKPLGRFFQVTETLDLKKYFLDIDKIQKFPITFVIKSNEDIDSIKQKIEFNAKKAYSVSTIVDKYMECIEEIINIPVITERFSIATEKGYLNDILNEIINQSKVEFNFSDVEEASIDDLDALDEFNSEADDISVDTIQTSFDFDNPT